MKMMTMLSALLLVGSMARAADTKIAFVDMQKAVQSTAAGKKAKSDLEGELEKRKKDLQKKDADLKKMREDLEKKKSVLSEEALAKKQQEFQEEFGQFQQTVQKSQLELQKREQDLTGPILKKMKTVIEKVAKDKGYTLVLENSAMVLYASKDADITDDVVKAFEKEK